MGKQKIIIVGGCAAGMMAAITAARAGAAVVLVEKNDSLGRKLLATGNGRCNLSHRPLRAESFYSDHPDFISSFLSAWDTDTLLAELGRLGLACSEESGRIYPRHRRADAVVDLLEYHVKQSGVEVITNAPVTAISRSAEGFIIKTRDRQEMMSPRLLLTVGGKAGPIYGSKGDGYRWARELGHKVITPRPALVPMIAKQKRLFSLQGVKCIVRGRITVSGRDAAVFTDELLFTKYGFSGPLAMNLSRQVIPEALCIFHIDFFPEWTTAELERKLCRPELPLAIRLQGFLPPKLVNRLLKLLDINPDIGWHDLAPKEQQLLITSLKDWEEEIAGVKKFNDAKVTAGGVDVRDVSPETLSSNLAKGLYFAGEILDVDGLSGGHNLHFAFASGIAAGRAAASN